jgi:hypothetical protein
MLSVYFSSDQGFGKPDLPVRFPSMEFRLRYRYHNQTGSAHLVGFEFATKKNEICYGAMSYTPAITAVNRKELLHFLSLGSDNPFN